MVGTSILGSLNCHWSPQETSLKFTWWGISAKCRSHLAINELRCWTLLRWRWHARVFYVGFSGVCRVCPQFLITWIVMMMMMIIIIIMFIISYLYWLFLLQYIIYYIIIVVILYAHGYPAPCSCSSQSSLKRSEEIVKLEDSHEKSWRFTILGICLYLLVVSYYISNVDYYSGWWFGTWMDYFSIYWE